MDRARLFTLFGVLVLAPVLAAVLITTLLLLGADPHWVFLPGHLVKSRFHVPNAVGVLTTELVWWGLVVLLWLALRRIWRLRRKARQQRPSTSSRRA